MNKEDGNFYYIINEKDQTITPIDVKASLRDQFAMAALTGALAGRVVNERTEWARAAYELADAMLKAREAK